MRVKKWTVFCVRQLLLCCVFYSLDSCRHCSSLLVLIFALALVSKLNGLEIVGVAVDLPFCFWGLSVLVCL